MFDVLPERIEVKADPGQLLWIGGESYHVTPLPDLPLFKSAVKLEKWSGDRAVYYAAESPCGPVCSCGDGGYCIHIPVLRSLGFLPPAKGLQEEVEALFFGEDH